MALNEGPCYIDFRCWNNLRIVKFMALEKPRKDRNFFSCFVATLSYVVLFLSIIPV